MKRLIAMLLFLLPSAFSTEVGVDLMPYLPITFLAIIIISMGIMVHQMNKYDKKRILGRRLMKVMEKISDKKMDSIRKEIEVVKFSLEWDLNDIAERNLKKIEDQM